MLKCVLDSSTSSSAQVCEDTVDSCGILPIINTMHTGTVPAAWSHSCPLCTQLRGSERDKLPGCWGALLAVPLHPELSAGQEPALVSHPLRPPQPCKSHLGQQRGGHRAHGHGGLTARQLSLPLRTWKPQRPRHFCMQGSPGEEQPGRGSGRKFPHTKDRTETQV